MLVLSGEGTLWPYPLHRKGTMSDTVNGLPSAPGLLVWTAVMGHSMYVVLVHRAHHGPHSCITNCCIDACSCQRVCRLVCHRYHILQRHLHHRSHRRHPQPRRPMAVLRKFGSHWLLRPDKRRTEYQFFRYLHPKIQVIELSLQSQWSGGTSGNIFDEAAVIFEGDLVALFGDRVNRC